MNSFGKKCKKYLSEFIFGDSDNPTDIKVFYSFRFILFLFIFIHHSFNYNYLVKFRQPALGVSAFIILSGFLNGYIYKNKYDKIKLKDIISFTWKRIKKFYPLHILMILVTISYSNLFNFSNLIEFINFIKRLIKNILLIQSWWPYDYFSFNGVTWYLSAYVFLTFLTIPLLYIINKINKTRYSKIKLILIAIMNLFLSCILVYYVKANHLKEEFWIYVFPPSRIFEYFIGLIFGSFFSKDILYKQIFKNKIFEKTIFTIFEIFAIFILCEFTFKFYKIPNVNKFFSERLNQYIIPTIILLCVFIFQKGYISKLLSIRGLVYLGKISMYMFMIHQPLINLLGKKPVHYRYYCLWMLFLTIIFGTLVDRYYKYKNIVKQSQNCNKEKSTKYQYSTKFLKGKMLKLRE